MPVEEYDTLVAISSQVDVCIQQLDYLRQLVASIGQSTENTDSAINHLYTSQAAVAQYTAEQYPNGRPDESSGGYGENESNENEGEQSGGSDNGGYGSESEGSESSDEENTNY